MKKIQTEIIKYIIKEIREKVVVITKEKDNSTMIEVPKYRMPLEITAGSVLQINEMGMYEIYK